MDKKRKIVIFSTIGAFILLLLCSVPIFTAYVEYRVENGIRKAAEKVTGREIGIGNVSYDLWSTRMTLQELSLPNPPEYSQVPALNISSITLDLEPFAIFKEEIHIQNLSVDGVTFTVEFKETPYSPKDLLDLVMKREINFLEFTKKKDKKFNEKSNLKSAKAKKNISSYYVKIDNLSITNCKVILENYTLFPKKYRTLSLPDYNLKNLGADEKITVNELFTKIFTMQAEKIKEELQKKVEEIQAKVKELKEKMKEILERLKAKDLSWAERKKLLEEVKQYALQLAEKYGVHIRITKEKPAAKGNVPTP